MARLAPSTADRAPCQPLLLDVDTGIDDAVAAAYLLASPEAEILAITCTAGNVPAVQVATNTLALLELCRAPAGIVVALGPDGPPIPARPPAVSHGPRGTGYARLPAPARALAGRPGPDVWVDLARRRPGELIGVVTGPLTSLALALLVEPELPWLLRRLVLMGGAFDRAGATPRAEWNFSCDPDAAAAVLAAFAGLPAARLPLVCPLDVTESLLLTPAHLRRFAERAGSEPAEALSPTDPARTRSRAANPLVRYLSDALRFAMEASHARGQGYVARPHDAFAAAVALHPGFARARPAMVDVELEPGRLRGATAAHWPDRSGRPPTAAIVRDTDPAAFLDHLIDRLGALARDLGTGPAGQPGR